MVSESAELRAPIPNSGNYATSMIRVFRSVTKPEQELDRKRGRGADISWCCRAAIRSAMTPCNWLRLQMFLLG